MKFGILYIDILFVLTQNVYIDLDGERLDIKNVVRIVLRVFSRALLATPTIGHAMVDTYSVNTKRDL